ncbi:hypothetical protein HCH_03478 [Hahella chejuensis KCTC 2396]|uniref:Uncharacterized protein n=1 Tax=Hahella chejuensis (strain KCTC 2396) TaxID=349521 RepID=Q2SGK0_HAHCH|nr:hypothetical protein HCH_03478 [Hahella chejuensis KCTC 2396]
MPNFLLNLSMSDLKRLRVILDRGFLCLFEA